MVGVGVGLGLGFRFRLTAFIGMSVGADRHTLCEIRSLKVLLMQKAHRRSTQLPLARVHDIETDITLHARFAAASSVCHVLCIAHVLI